MGIRRRCDDRCVLVVSLSARALARSARRGGIGVRAVDVFGDRDTRALCDAWAPARADESGFIEASLREAVATLDPEGSASVVYGSGFEAAPQRLTAFGAGRELLGNPPEVVAALKSPRRFAERLRALGIPHPEVRFEAIREQGWLVKRAGGSGGGHVRPFEPAGALDAHEYLQRFVPGRCVSLTVLADGREVRVVGLAEQWNESARSAHGFVYAGAVALAERAVSARVRAQWADAVAALVRAEGARGLFCVDFLQGDGDWWLLEANPRPGASFELHEAGAGLFRCHLRAARGRLPRAGGARASGARAHRVVYAAYAGRVPHGLSWPRWVSDRPRCGLSFAVGEPLCTVHARAADSDAAVELLSARYRSVLARVDAWPRTSLAGRDGGA